MIIGTGTARALHQGIECVGAIAHGVDLMIGEEAIDPLGMKTRAVGDLEIGKKIRNLGTDRLREVVAVVEGGIEVRLGIAIGEGSEAGAVALERTRKEKGTNNPLYRTY